MLLGSHAFADVGVRAEPPQNPSFRVTDGNSSREEPAVVAIPTAEGERVFPDLAALETFADLGHNLLHMVWVMYLLPTPASHLHQGSAGVIKPSLVVPEDVALLIGHPRQLGNVVRQGAEALLTFAQRFLRKLASEAVPLDDTGSRNRDQEAQGGSEDQNCFGLDQVLLRICVT